MHETTEKLFISDQRSKGLTFLIYSCLLRVLTIKKTEIKQLVLYSDIYIYTTKDTAASYLPNVSDHDCCQRTSLEKMRKYILNKQTHIATLQEKREFKRDRNIKPQERRFLRQSACNPGRVWLQHYQLNQIFQFASQQSLSKQTNIIA